MEQEQEQEPYWYIDCPICGHEHLIDATCPDPDEQCDTIGCSHGGPRI